MDITFGIITNGEADDRVQEIVNSIRYQNIPNYEIIIVGDTTVRGHDIFNFGYDERVRPKPWITMKKNMITEIATYQYVVYMHDYVALTEGWYQGVEEFGENFYVCMHRILNKDGTRFRDWCAWDDPAFGTEWVCREPWCGSSGMKFAGTMKLVPYSYNTYKHMYVSGTYWMADKTFMQKYPLNNSILHGEGEDVEWSLRARVDNKWVYKMNPGATVQLLKQK